MSTPLATHDHADLASTLEFLKRTRSELRALKFTRVGKDFVRVFDVNKDFFEIRGLGYGDADVIAALRAVNAAFDPRTIHDPIADDYKEFDTGRRYVWAQDRVM